MKNTSTERLLGAVFIGLAFLLFALGCSGRKYPVTPSASKAFKNQRSATRAQFP
ncbi:MAG: hypothetical protein ACK52I_00685 [Pseudomonadota bacterium]|jgi:hypothetical protein